MRPGLVGGRYRVGDLLGAGSTGEVYAAFDERLEVPVALKLALPDATARLLDQARAAAGLVHPRVGRVLDLGEHEGRGYVVTDLVRGASAVTLLQERPPTARQAALAAAAAADGLTYLHGRGVVHGDLAPGNVQVPDEGGWAAAVLLDVGGVVLEADGSVRASPWYCAPEVARGAASPESDVYGLAAVLYHLLTGAPAYDHADPAVALAAHGTEPWVAPSSRRPDLPRDLDVLLHAAMSVQPQQRPPAARLRDDLLTLAPRCPQVAVAPVRAAGGTRRLVPVPQATVGGVARGAGAIVPRAPQGAAADRGRPGRVAAVAVILLLASTAVGLWVARPAGTPVEATSSASATTPAPGAATPQTAAVVVATTPAAPATATVPELVGLEQRPARSALEAVGLVVGSVVDVDVPAPAGTVVDVQPSAGSVLPLGSAVGLSLASGLVVVPSVAGAQVQDALAALTSAGLTGEVRRVGGGAAGMVAATEPAPGSRLDVGGLVLLSVGRGRLPHTHPAPTPTTSASPAPSTSPSGQPEPSQAAEG